MLFGVFLILGVFLIVAQTTLFPLLPETLGNPDFLYIVIVFAAYRFSWGGGLVYVYILGWMMDVVSGIHLGLYPLENIIVFSAMKLLTENSPLKENTYQVPLVGVSYFLVQMGFYFLYSMIAANTLPPWSWNRIVQETFILLFATIPAFLLLNAVYEYFDKQRVIHRVMRKRGGSNQFR
jgi:rod shape-determining protein MreD